MKNLRYNNYLPSGIYAEPCRSKEGLGKVLCLRVLAILCLLMASMGAWAADYLIKSGNYYIGMNAAGNALQAYTTPDASCVWTCLNNTTETTLSTTSRSMRNKKNTRYYLTATVTRGGNAFNRTYTWTIGAGTTATVWWRGNNGNFYATDGTYSRNASISVAANGTISLTDNTTTSSQYYVGNSVTGETTYAGGLTAVNVTNSTLIYNANTDATLTALQRTKSIDPTYADFNVGNNTHYYWYNNALTGTKPTGSPTNVNLTGYTWSISGAGAEYLSLASTTGDTNTITYGKPCPNDGVTATISVTANYAEGGSATQIRNISLTKYTADPTAINASNMELTVGATQSVNPTLTCAIPDYSNIYTSLSYASNNTAVASVNATTGVVTANAKGTATITITARLQGGGSITKDITVSVAERAAAPTITFNNTTGELTMSSTTPGAEIHYTLTGSDPTSGSSTYDPAHKPVLTEGATVKAIATADGYIASNVTTLVVEQVATPTITVDGTTVKLACSTDGVTYYYTTDDSEPTLSSTNTTSTTLTTIPSGSTLKVMAVKNGMVNSEVASKYVELSLATPTITISDGKVTMTSPDGATIHYTTDGSTPTASSPTYSAPLTATNGVTYKAIAIKAGFADSEVAEEKYMIASGVSGGTVTINDYEDHNWTYYQSPENLPAGYPAYLSSPDPRNVIITYRGGSVNNASAVAISGLTGEGQNEMIYYKTLEKTVLGMTGNYPYQVISNPFSKRPRTNGSTGTNGYFGFAGWKIISGGKYIAEHADNDVLGLDEIIHFTNLDENYTPNCKSGEVIFEATWTAATVKTGTTAQTFTGGTYETNFWVITGNTGNISLGAPCTMSARYPDGTSAGNNSIGTGGGTTITTTVDNVKIEFLNLNTTGAITADGRNFTMGRGITWSRTAGQITCGNRARAHTVKIESGKYGSLYHFTAAVSGAATNQLVILGNDYDRAKNDNAKLEITGQMIDANANTVTGVASQCYVRSVVKSGSFMTGVSVGSGAYTASYYFGGYGSNNRHVGRRFLTIEGGEFTGSVCGGTDASSHGATARAFDLRVRGNAVINGAVYGGAENAQCYGVRTMIFTGGTVKGWVCAAANGTSNTNGDLTGTTYLYMGGNSRVDSNGSHTVINRSVGGNVFAAGCGYQANNATSGLVRNGTNLVVADNTYIERGAYGGGSYGFSANTQTTNIFITGGHVAGKNGGVNGTAWDASVPGGVYGGACQNAGGTINITMTGGLVEGGLYGGSNVTGTIAGKVTMQIDGGQVGTTTTAANVHGGGLGQPTRVNNDVEITLGKTGAARDADGVTVWGDVYGGSALGYVNGTTAADTYHTYVTMNAGYIHGSLYGGALGNAGTEANVYGPVQVKVYGGSVWNTDGTGTNGSGAVYGANNINGAPQRSVTVDIYGTNSAPAEGEYALFSVYGGGNAANYTYGNGYPKVTVHNCDNSIEYVYGGGNAAAVAATDVTIYGGDKIGNVFGGGNGQVKAANVNGNTSVKIYGGTIGDVYGGSNTNGTIGGTISVTVNKTAEDGGDGCDMKIDNVYGGGNKAASNVGSVTIGCTGTKDGEGINAVYGGANQANITGNIDLRINSGTIKNVFGGNNTSGTISGTITVTVNENTSAGCGKAMEVGNVYGGGNKAAYGTGTNYPVVNIQNGHLTGSVFGGGLGETAVVTGNPQVTIGANTGTVHIDGNVFGGGDAANVVGKPVVLVQNCNTQIGTKDGEGNWNAVGGTVYGGGNAADVTGADNGTSVTINGGDINRVFGGGNGEVSPANVEGNAVTTIHAGNIHQAFAGSNMQGNISGSATITVDHDGTCDEKIDEVYGGGNQAAGNAGTVTIDCGAIIGDVYGGANAADINSPITLNITGGTIDRVFGGNNTSGNISGAIIVNVEKDDECVLDLNSVYGAGNQAAYTPTDASGAYPAVNILKGTVKQNVYGGGLGATAVVTSNPVVTLQGGTVGTWTDGVCAENTGNIFGGGDAAPVKGNPTVTATDGTAAKIFAGGKGATAIVTGNPTAELNKADAKSLTVTEIYGGGDAAEVTGNTTVALTKGTVTNAFGGGNAAAINGNTLVTIADATTGNVYGGGNLAGVKGTTTINMTGGQVTEGLYGGCNSEGTVTGDIAISITNGTVGTNATNTANVHGGGYGAATATEGNVTVNVNGASVNIWGDVYGGSALGNVNNEATDLTKVQLDKGTVHGNIYGGGLGAKNGVDGATADVAAVVNGEVQVVVNGGTVTEKIFGCNNLNGTPKADVTVTINGTDAPSTPGSYALSEVYGGGNMADYVPTKEGAACKVVVNNCDNSIGYVYGGGNAADVASTDVTINGGNIGTVFGGGHGDKDAEPQTEANVTGNVNVKIYGGTINQVFAGSNSKGTINGTATLTVNKPNDGTCEMHITEVYGGGNQAAGNAGVINIGCTGGETEGITDVYGGAREANVTSGITLNITGGNINRVFGGNNISGSITGAIEVNINEDGTNCGMNLNYVYGAGNQADYSGSPVVNIKKGTVNQDVFGGGLQATVGGNTQVNVTGGKVTHDVYGGGALANVNGNTEVNLTGGSVGGAYGGGLGQLASDAVGTEGEPGYIPAKEAVAALVSGNATVTLNGSAVTGDGIFGANNVNGTPKGHVFVHVLSTVPAGNGATYHVPAVYGGGNQAAYQPTSDADFAEVLIENCDNSIEYVYGGGNAAPVPATKVTIKGANAINNAFAGGNGAGAGNPGADVGYLGYFSKGSATPYGTGKAEINVQGGTVNNVYGGSNTLGYIYGGTTVNVEDKDGACPLHVGNIFGGGNEAPIYSDITLKLDCSEGGTILYGGANNADVGNITLNIVSGTFGKVFCGNNTGGAVKGKLTVNVDETGCWPVMIGELYGGGNMAAYSVYGYNGDGTCKTSGDRVYDDPVVNLISFTRIGKVFGGGYGNTAALYGNTHVNVDPIKGIFAGKTTQPLYILDAQDQRVSNAAGNISIPDAVGTIGSIYGGGNAGAVYGDTYVNIGFKETNKHISGADQTTEQEVAVNITGNVFGGGNEAIVSGDTHVTIGENRDPLP